MVALADAPDGDRLRRLRWRCRRGMRELDRLLERRLDHLLAEVAENDGSCLDGFERLLDCEDDQLWRWCLGKEVPADAAVKAEIDAIRTNGHA